MTVLHLRRRPPTSLFHREAQPAPICTPSSPNGRGCRPARNPAQRNPLRTKHIPRRRFFRMPPRCGPLARHPCGRHVDRSFPRHRIARPHARARSSADRSRASFAAKRPRYAFAVPQGPLRRHWRPFPLECLPGTEFRREVDTTQFHRSTRSVRLPAFTASARSGTVPTRRKTPAASRHRSPWGFRFPSD